MTDPTIDLDEKGHVKMLKVADPEVKKVLVPVQDDNTLEEPVTLDVIAELTEEELEEEFNKLSMSDQIKYNQWVEFHETYQRSHGITGTSSQIFHYNSDLNKPAIPSKVAKEELANVDIDEEQVQIVKMVDKDGKMVKVKPILIKKELDREHATKIPFERHLGEMFLTDAERVPLRTTPPVEYFEEATDDEDYKEDEEVTSIESNSSAANSMLDEDFETTDPVMFDTSLMKITARLKQATEGFEELRKMLPSVLVTDISKLIEETPLPYLTPLSKAMVQALQSVREERLVDLALHEEHSKGASQVSLMLKYGATRNRLHKIITETSRPGGSQYQQTVKKEMKDRPVTSWKKESQIKTETSTQAEVSKKGKGRDKSGTQK